MGEPTPSAAEKPNCKCIEQGYPEEDCKWHGRHSGQAVDRQEWTLEVGELADIIVIGYRRLPCLDRRTAKLLVDAHNAELAAETYKVEMERYRRESGCADDQTLVTRILQLRATEAQLLSALAAIEKHNKQADQYRICWQIDVDPSLLGRHDAELTEKVRKPLVDLLSRANECLKHTEYATTMVPEITDALAQCKQP